MLLFFLKLRVSKGVKFVIRLFSLMLFSQLVDALALTDSHHHHHWQYFRIIGCFFTPALTIVA